MLPDFKLETFFSKWEFKAKYHMCASDMETLTLTQLLELASNEDREKWNNLPLKYIETYVHIYYKINLLYIIIIFII